LYIKPVYDNSVTNFAVQLYTVIVFLCITNVRSSIDKTYSDDLDFVVELRICQRSDPATYI